MSSQSAHDILQSAANLVGGDRQKQHGDKEKTFKAIAVLWDAYFRARRDTSLPLTAEDVANMMSLLKTARTQSGAFNEDDYIDAAGYSAIAGELRIIDRKRFS